MSRHHLTDFAWTDEAVEKLKALTDEGLTCSQIGLHFGVSRNAIIGKQHRLGIKSKNSPSQGTSFKPLKPLRRRRTRRVKRLGGGMAMLESTTTIEPVELPTETFADPKPLLALERGQCRWPESGDGVALQFCGAPTFKKHSYCYHHCCIAYSAPPRMTRAELEIHQRKLSKNYKSAA